MSVFSIGSLNGTLESHHAAAAAAVDEEEQKKTFLMTVMG